MQRLPRYIMLLNDLIKHTPMDHPDYNNLKQASVSISEVTVFINEAISATENLNKIIEIEKSIEGEHPVSIHILKNTLI